ncbi:MAG: AzlC family ABC transporter permease [Bifidobacteriaceae bacterium]|nr:AzlC family ABC transporter permease [Bifidobacteriaceae bacterium]
MAVATGLYGISFGALAVASGLSVAHTMVLSAVLFSGASQFALVGVIGAGGSVAAAVASAALLGVRNGLYGLQMSPLTGARGIRRLAAAHLTIDESTGVAGAQVTPEAARTGFWRTGLGVWVCWNVLTLAGALAGDAMGDPRAWGLDAAASAAFLGLLWPRLALADEPHASASAVTSVHPNSTRRDAQMAAGLAAVIAIALVPVTPPGVPVLGAVAAAIVVGLWRPGQRLATQVGAST